MMKSGAAVSADSTRIRGRRCGLRRGAALACLSGSRRSRLAGLPSTGARCPPRPCALFSPTGLRAIRSSSTSSIFRKLRERFGAELPSKQTIRRFIAREFPQSQLVYEQKGPRTFRATVQEPILRDLSSIEPGEIFVGDHRQFDLEVINPERHGELERPWITCWFDLGSRAPIGWVIGFEPASKTIGEAFAVAVGAKSDPVFANLCGLPNVVHQDNGKDYRAEVLDHLYREVGVKVVQALPFNAKSKLVERFFGTVSQQFDRDFPEWVGNTPGRRTERVRELRTQHAKWLKHEAPSTPFITIAEFRRRFAAWVQEYMQQPHDGLFESETGRTCTPAQKAAERRLPIRLPDARSLAMLTWPRVDRVVRKGMLRLDRTFFYSAPELVKYEGQRVELCRDPANVLRGIVWTPDHKFVEVAAKKRLAFIRPGHDDAITLADVAEANRRQREEEKQLREARRIREERIAREGRGGSHLDEVVAERPPTPPAAPSAPVIQPEAAVAHIHPIDRVARAQRAAEVAADRPTTPAAAAESDEAWIERLIGLRPVVPEFCTDLERARIERDAEEWDREAARRLQARANA
jgi:hypothetical protein